MITTDTQVKWYPGAQKRLKGQPDKVLYAVASMTLDMTYPTIPKSNLTGSGKLRQTSKSAGVRGSNGDYYIGSYTEYAKYVNTYPTTTNWSTPGTTSNWYKKTWKKKGKVITDNAIGRNQLK